MSKNRWKISFAPEGDGLYEVTVRRTGSVYRFKTKLPPDISDLWTADNGATEQTNRQFRKGSGELTPEARFFQAANLPTLKEIGGRLLSSVIDLDGGNQGIETIGALKERMNSNEGVDIEFDLSQTAELSGIPWESLYLGGEKDQFLAIFSRTNIVRKLDAQSELPPPIERPIRILVAAANPKADLDTDAELGNIQRRIDQLVTEGSSEFEIASLPAATRDDFRRKVNDWKPHIIHYIGHSSFKNDTGYLYFESEKEGQSDQVSAETMRNILLNRRPWMVILNSCQSGQTSRELPMAGVAQNLLQRLNIPFVVAMQQPVSDDAAINFSQDFYSALTDGEPIANAVTIGRCAIANNADERTQVELITPALYTSGETDRIHFVEREDPAPLIAKTGDDKETAPSEKKDWLGLTNTRLAVIAGILGSLTVIGTNLETIWSFFGSEPDQPGPAPTSSPTAVSTSTPTPSPVPTPDATPSEVPDEVGNQQTISGSNTGNATSRDPSPMLGQQSATQQTSGPNTQDAAATQQPREDRTAAMQVRSRPVPPQERTPTSAYSGTYQAGTVVDVDEQPVLITEVPEDTSVAYALLQPGTFANPGTSVPLLVPDDEEQSDWGRPYRSKVLEAVSTAYPTSGFYEYLRAPVYCQGHYTGVNFDFASSAVDSESGESLRNWISALDCPSSRIVIAGFTDAAGPLDVNIDLSFERAEEVAKIVRGEPNGSRSETTIMAFAEDSPYLPTEDGKREPLNRRAEVYIDFDCSSLLDVERTLSADESFDGAPPPVPYPASAEDMRPLRIVYHSRDIFSDDVNARQTAVVEAQARLNELARQVYAEWDVPPQMISSIMMGDKCLAPGEDKRVDIDF